MNSSTDPIYVGLYYKWDVTNQTTRQGRPGYPKTFRTRKNIFIMHHRPMSFASGTV